MCGILFSLEFRGEAYSVPDDLIPWISVRGPDSLGTHKVQIQGIESQQGIQLTFASSVLHLRGQKITKQPLCSEGGDVLCWNGEIWQGLELEDYENDGLKLLAALASGERVVWDIMGNIEGPWAMVYYASKEKRLYYGRDFLGRRSLVRRTVPQSEVLQLSSVGVDMLGWEEVGVDGWWCIDLNEWVKEGRQVCNTRDVLSQCPAKLYPWVFESRQSDLKQDCMV